VSEWDCLGDMEMNGTLNELPNMQYTYIYIYMQLDAAGKDLAYKDTL
jgi:hypothetical protein